jgi:hypothetical protein
MAIENIPTWSFEANWSNPFTETLEWLTSILTSPTGAEQRRSLRLYPRRELEFTVTVPFEERAAAENFIMLHGARDFHCPLWHEAYRLDAPALSGSGALLVRSAGNGGIVAGDVVFIGSPTNSLEFELVEVQSVAANLITLVAPISRTWGKSAKVHPIRKARFIDQPNLAGKGDSIATGTINVQVMEQNNDAVSYAALVDQLPTYSGFGVLTALPDFVDNAQRSFVRMVESYDNTLSFPIFRDTANRSFPTQSFRWTNRGRAEYDAFRKLLYALSGRFRPVWLPSHTADFRMVADTPAGAQYIQVGNIGYTASGGITGGRTTICILLTDGTQLYRTISTSTVTSSGDEVLALNTAFPSGLTASSVARISFMELSRLDQDRFEIVHQTDTQGVSNCTATFRAAPNIREERAGF